jgi:esterase/lipase
MMLRLGKQFPFSLGIGMCVPISIDVDLEQFERSLEQQIKSYRKQSHEDVVLDDRQREKIKNTIHQLDHFLQETVESIEFFPMPIMLIQAGKDEWVTKEHTERLFERIQTKHKRRILFDEARHLITIGRDREKLSTTVLEILTTYIQ